MESLCLADNNSVARLLTYRRSFGASSVLLLLLLSGCGLTYNPMADRRLTKIIQLVMSPSTAIGANRSNFNRFTVAGACGVNGQPVYVSITSSGGTGSVSPLIPPTCESGRFTTLVDLTSLPDGVLTLSMEQRDAQGQPTESQSEEIIKDRTAPTVPTFTASGGQNALTSNATPAFTLTFSEPIDPASLTASDLSSTGTALITGWTITDSGDHMTFTIQPTVSGEGTVIPRLAAGSVTDPVGNPVGTAATSSVTVTRDATAPTVATFTTPASQPLLTNSTSAAFSLTFSEPILASSLTAADFSNAGTASVSGWTIVDSGNHASFTVVATLSSNGTVIPRLASGSVQDPAGNSIEGAAASSANTVVRDVGVPTVSISAGATIDSSNEQTYPLAGTCSEEGRLVTVKRSTLLLGTPECVSGGTWSLEANFSALATGTITLTADHRDAAGNAAIQASRAFVKSSPSNSQGPFTVQITPDTLLPTQSLQPTFTVIFGAPIDPGTFLTAPGTPSAVLDGIIDEGTGWDRVTVLSWTGEEIAPNDGMTFRLTANLDAATTAGSLQPAINPGLISSASNASDTNLSTAWDATGPVVVDLAPPTFNYYASGAGQYYIQDGTGGAWLTYDPNTPSTIQYLVTASEPLSPASVLGSSLQWSGSLSGCASPGAIHFFESSYGSPGTELTDPSVTSVTQFIIQVNLTQAAGCNLAQTGNLQLTIPASAFTDLAGNSTLAGTVPSGWGTSTQFMVLPATLPVQAAYPNLSHPGSISTWYKSDLSTECTGAETTSCQFVGDAIRVLTEAPGCDPSIVTISDDLHAFDWSCAVSSGKAQFIGRLKADVSLSALMDSTAAPGTGAGSWKPNPITVQYFGGYSGPSATSSSAPLWSDPIDIVGLTGLTASLNYGSESAHRVKFLKPLDDPSTGGPFSAYPVQELSVTGNHVTLLMEPGLQPIVNGAENCNSTDGTSTAPNLHCLLRVKDASFFLTEMGARGYHYTNSCVGTCPVVPLEAGIVAVGMKHSQIRRSLLEVGGRHASAPYTLHAANGACTGVAPAVPPTSATGLILRQSHYNAIYLDQVGWSIGPGDGYGVGETSCCDLNGNCTNTPYAAQPSGTGYGIQLLDSNSNLIGAPSPVYYHNAALNMSVGHDGSPQPGKRAPSSVGYGAFLSGSSNNTFRSLNLNLGMGTESEQLVGLRLTSGSNGNAFEDIFGGIGGWWGCGWWGCGGVSFGNNTALYSSASTGNRWLGTWDESSAGRDFTTRLALSVTAMGMQRYDANSNLIRGTVGAARGFKLDGNSTLSFNRMSPMTVGAASYYGCSLGGCIEANLDGGIAYGIEMLDAGSSYSTETSPNNAAGDAWFKLSSRTPYSDGIYAGSNLWAIRQTPASTVTGFDVYATLYEGYYADPAQSHFAGANGDIPTAALALNSSSLIDLSALSFQETPDGFGWSCAGLDGAQVTNLGSATVTQWNLCMNANQLNFFMLVASLEAPPAGQSVTIQPRISAGVFTDLWGQTNRQSVSRSPSSVTWKAP